MRISNSIQNTQSTNFGELRFSPEGRRAVGRCKDFKTIDKLINAKKSMSATGYYDIVVGENLKCKLVSVKDALFQVFKSGQFKTVKNGINKDVLELDEYSVYRHPLPETDNEVGYNVWKNVKNAPDIESVENIDELVKIANELDMQARNNETAIETMMRKMKNNLLNT